MLHWLLTTRVEFHVGVHLQDAAFEDNNMLSFCDLSLDIPPAQNIVLPGRSGSGLVHRGWQMRRGCKGVGGVFRVRKGNLEIQGDMALGADRQIFAGHAKNEKTIQKRQVEEIAEVQ